MDPASNPDVGDVVIALVGFEVAFMVGEVKSSFPWGQSGVGLLLLGLAVFSHSIVGICDGWDVLGPAEVGIAVVGLVAKAWGDVGLSVGELKVLGPAVVG